MLSSAKAPPLLALVAFILAAAPAAAVDRTFTGAASNDWFNASNWNPVGVPAAADNVSGTADRTADATVTNVTLTAGTLTGSGNLTATGAFNWSGGVQSGTGTTTISATGTLTISARVTLQRSVVNSGTTTWTGEVDRRRDDGTDAVSGTFAGLAEGATCTVSGTNLQISYVGDTGNDVVLTARRGDATRCRF